MVAEVGNQVSAASSAVGVAGPFHQGSLQAAPGREDSTPVFCPETQFLGPQVGGAPMAEPTFEVHELVQGSGVLEGKGSVMLAELGAPGWQHVFRRRARQRGHVRDLSRSEGKGSLSSSKPMVLVEPSPPARATSGRGRSHRVSCSVVLGSAVFERPMESEELRGFEAVFDDAFLGVVASAVPVPPFRPGIGKGIGQRECECSLATSVRVAEERHEESGGLCGEETADGIADEIARESEKCFANLEMLRVFVYELEGLSARARHRRVVALRPFLERAEACVSVYTPAAIAILAEIQAALV